jgi:tetratricopeptide (TPR) repeat protein
MNHNNNILEEIIARRIPHIIGMYIAAVWLAVEISDWMSAKFDISTQLSTVVFIGLLAMLPSVIMVAWGHGRPGKDHWTRIELAWVPINIALAFFVIHLSVAPRLILIDSTTNIVQNNIISPIPEPIVKKISVDTQTLSSEINQNKHQSILSFFWQNKTSDSQLDWLSYGATWLYSQDLKRTPVLSVQTPYDSKNILSQMIAKGFNSAVDIPLSVALQIAQKSSEKWFVIGSFAKSGENLIFSAKLYETERGLLKKELTAENKNWLSAINQISHELGQYLIEQDVKNKNVIPNLSVEDHTSNSIEAIKHLIAAKNSIAFDNDYQKAIEEILQAIQLDNRFADAHVLAISYYRALGDFEKAKEHSEKALALDDKLYEETAYLIKANLFAMSGKQQKAVKVVENWAKVFPKSTLALSSLGQQYLMLENQLDKAKEVYERLSSIEGEKQGSLVNLGKIYRVQEQQSKSLEVLEKYLKANPKKVEAYMELADAYIQFSFFNKAKDMYEQASFIGSKNYAAEIGMAKATALLGDVNGAIFQLDELLKRDNSDREIFNLLNQKIELFFQTGQLQKAHTSLQKADEYAKKVFSPLIYMFETTSTKIDILVKQGQYKEAIKYAKEMKKNAKPPFSDIASVFLINIYRAQEDEENFKLELQIFENFLATFPASFYNQIVVAWKAKSAHWDGNMDKSIMLLNQAIAESKQSIWGLQTYKMIDELIYSKAVILFEKGQDRQAFESLNLLLKRNPLYAKAYHLKALIYKKENKIENAQSSINKAKEIWKHADSDFTDLIKLKNIKL